MSWLARMSLFVLMMSRSISALMMLSKRVVGLESHCCERGYMRCYGHNKSNCAMLGRQEGGCRGHRRHRSTISSFPSSSPPSSCKSSKQLNTRNTAFDQSGGVRINKCLSSMSRRGADEAIREGRVTVNNKPAVSGQRVFDGDKVMLDGRLQRWEKVAKARNENPRTTLEERQFIYIKYWKERGVTCTNDRKDKTNIIAAGGFDLFPQRMFTVGRLDKESTGLILLTSDGRVNNAMLSPKTKKEKSYEVSISPRLLLSPLPSTQTLFDAVDVYR